MQFSFQAPLNNLSLGQVSFNLLYEFYKKGLTPAIFKASDHPVDHSAYDYEEDFLRWVQVNLQQAATFHSREVPTLRVWHINDSWRNYSDRQILLTFHETDTLTETEKKIASYSELCVTSNHTRDVFKQKELESTFIPLGFDSKHFFNTNKKYFDDGRITFNLCGKFEKRKHHEKIIRAWVKKYGKDKKYSLQCALHNQFYKDPNELKMKFSDILDNKHIFNVMFMQFMPKNSVYNDYLNSSDIIIGMSGGEGWGLPEFHSAALGKHSVILNASGYKDWANKNNSVLVDPSSKAEVYDSKFFTKGSPFNQGNIYDFNEDAFIDGCEKAVERHLLNPINEEGLKLQEQFTYEKTANKLLSLI
jgi:hypothetical protein